VVVALADKIQQQVAEHLEMVELVAEVLEALIEFN
jgi:hypothetical protein